MTSRLRLADLLGGLSVATDLGFGIPPETAMRSCLFATGLARRLGVEEEGVRDTFYTSLLYHVGCPTYAHETAALFGNELTLLRAVARTNLADPADWVATMIPEATRGLSPRGSQDLARRLLREGPTFGRLFDIASCEVASAVARRVGLDAGVQRSLSEIGEWWDGSGVPNGLREEEISHPARIARAMADAAVLEDMGGAELAVAGLRARAGSLLDPAVVDGFATVATELVTDARGGDPRERLLEREPQPVEERTEEELREVAAAFGHVADLKLPALHGHSSGVAALAGGAAVRLRIDARSTAALEIAALLHDIGRLAVTNVIWQKPGPLTAAEWEQVRMHAYHSERILATSQALAEVAPIAGMHHERLDGSGYHRGCRARDQAPAVRVLAAADAFHAMTQARPHRDAMSPEQAADELGRAARAGLLDSDCVGAVLEEAGQSRPGRRRDLRPAGLSERELDVLRLVAEGLSNPEIATRLVISRRTAEHHVQHIYAKLGVSSRAAVALFALEHDLL